MKKVIFAVILLIAGAYAQSTDEEIPLNEGPFMDQVSDHGYVLHIPETGENIALVASEQGILLFDPPPEPDLSILIESLKNLNAGPVRWMINTGNYFLQTAGLEYFSKHGAVLLAGFRQYAPRTNPETPAPVAAGEPGSDYYEDSEDVRIPLSEGMEDRTKDSDRFRIELPVFPRFTFKRQMYLYPDDLEIQIRALQHEARTGADIFAYIPDEKVLFTGRLFEQSYYPDIDVSAGGSALKWIDALAQVIDSVPLLISAIPPEEDEESEEGVENGGKIIEGEEGRQLKEGEIEGNAVPEEEEEEIKLEEMITVVSARGEVSNLLMMKDLLDTAQKLRNGISRAVKSGRSCEDYLDSPNSYPYQTYGNYFPYATQLCKELSQKTEAGKQ